MEPEGSGSCQGSASKDKGFELIWEGKSQRGVD